MFYLLQFIVIIFSFAYALQNAMFTWPWRYGVEFPEKDKYQRGFHTWGGVTVAIVVLTPLLYNSGGLYLAVAFYALHSLVFDITYSLAIKQKWYYLGTTSVMDRFWGNGKRKAVILVVITIAANYLHIIK